MTERDRRFSLALAAAFAAHALLLFGITLPKWAPSIGAPLTVTLSTAPDARHEPTATIAAADQTGSDAVSRHSPAMGRSPERGTTDNAYSKTPGRGRDAADMPLLARLVPDAERYAGSGRLQAGGSTERVLTPEAMSRRTAAADPRAAYLEEWRNTVERAGNRKLPRTVLAGMHGERRLTMEVTLNADGGLVDMRLRRGSGYPELDAASRRILQDMAPFAPFPAALREHWPRLTFAYDWRFLPARENAIEAQAR